MKLAKMSMVAALLLGANAYAIDNVKVNGDAKLYYGTEDRSTDGVTRPDMFDKDASYADVALRLGVTADLSEGISAGATYNAVSTLGLENNLVSGVWSGGHGASASQGANVTPANAEVQVDDKSWFSEAWIAGTAGKTTAKVGRQAIDTPLAFTETWSITNNTFEAAVLINQDIPDTTLVGAWIGKSNGIGEDTWNGTANLGNVTSVGGKFNTFATDGAYAAGLINNSFKPLTFQAWYYDVQSVAKAYWLQADIECSLVEGLMIGAQYVDIDPLDAGVNAALGVSGADYKNDTAYSVMLGYAVKDVVTVKAAYSSVDDEGTLGVANVATFGADSGSDSKLYTEMFWNRGNVSAIGADSYAVTAEGTAAGIDLFAGYTFADIDVLGTANDREVTEIALTAGKSFGPLDATAALIMDEVDYGVNSTEADTDATSLQVYLTYNF